MSDGSERRQPREISGGAGLPAGHALIPRNPLGTLVEERAERHALQRLKFASHSMALENQSVDTDNERAQFQQLVKELVDESGSSLWEDE